MSNTVKVLLFYSTLCFGGEGWWYGRRVGDGRLCLHCFSPATTIPGTHVVLLQAQILCDVTGCQKNSGWEGGEATE